MKKKKILIEESFICNLFTNINYDNFNNEEDFLNDLEKKVRVINKNIPEYNYLGFLILLKNKELFLKFKNKYNLDIISYYLINSNSESKHINFIEELISQKQKNKIISSIKITDKQSKKRKI